MKSFRKFISCHIGYPMQDAFKGTSIGATLDFLRQSQTWNNDRMYEYRLDKLRKLVAHAHQHVPYYRRIFTNIGLSHHDIKSLADIKHIPILTKEIARKENIELVSQGLNMHLVKKGKTGGTTGSPLTIYKDVNDRSFTWASYYRWFNWMGMEMHDPVVSLWGAKTVTRRRIIGETIAKTVNFLQNNLVIDSFTMNDQTKPQIYGEIMRAHPVLIKGYLSSLLNMGLYMRKNALPPPATLKAISTTTETLMPKHRSELMDIFRVPIFDQYGCGEVSAISYECACHHGLHVNQEHVLIEVLDDQGADLLGSPGRVIVTGLDNLAMPFIRYENGDMATMSDERCPCGLKTPLMRSIDGRIADTLILTSGVKVHGVFFTDILFELGITVRQIPRFQARQRKPGEIILTLEAPGPLNEALIATIRSQLNRFFHTVDIQQTALIPSSPNGKFRYIVSEINRDLPKP